MHRLAIVLLAAGLVIPPAANAQTLFSCGQGSVRRVQSITEESAGRAVGLEPRSDHDLRRSYLVVVQLNDLVYTGRSSADVAWNFDPTSLVIGQEVSVCANDTLMVLDRQDGTDYRARVVSIGLRPRLETRRVTEAGRTQRARR